MTSQPWFKLGFGSWRLFLALLVGFSHLWSSMIQGPAAYAVWGFFVLSGYLMTHVLCSKYGFSARGLMAYGRNRFLRIFPSFWLASALGALLLWWLATQGVDARGLNPSFGIPSNAGEWSFIVTLLPAFPRWNGPVPVANALSIEVGFYLLMPFMARSRSTAWFALLMGIFIVAHHGLALESFSERYAWFLPSTPAFALGSLLFHYRAQLRHVAWPKTALLVWLAHAVAWEWFPTWPWTWGLYVSLLLSAWVVIALAELKVSKFDVAMGDLSYPFYLLHSAGGALLLPWFGFDRTLSFALFGISIALVASWVMVVLVDRPLGRKKSPALLGRGGREAGSAIGDVSSADREPSRVNVTATSSASQASVSRL